MKIVLLLQRLSITNQNNPIMRTTKIISLVILMTALFACSNKGSSESTGETIHLTKSEFLANVFNYEKSSVWNYEGNVPCVIDFYATWCGPCKRVAPIMEELAGQYKGKIKVYKIDTDKEQELAQAFNISSIPAVLFIPMKGQPQMQVGAMAKADYEKIINEFLLASK